MKYSYLALLRGVNVGGKNMLKMADLKVTLEKAGFEDVRTYIQSGNVLFSSSEEDKQKLGKYIEQAITKNFNLEVDVAIFTKAEWQDIITNAPEWWGKDHSWKHNLLVMVGEHDMKDVVAAVGTLKPEIEAMKPGKGVLYQSMSLKLFGRTTVGKLASNPVYKRMTVRNYNTAQKLLELL